MNSIGKTAIIIRGMPCGKHRPVGSPPSPPSARSAAVVSKIARDSAVNGACWPAPAGFDQSKLFPTPGGFFHWPDQSGYFERSCACAANVISAPIASIIDAMRLSMIVLPFPRTSAGQGDHTFAAPSSPERRTRLLQPAAEPHRADAAREPGRVIGL